MHGRVTSGGEGGEESLGTLVEKKGRVRPREGGREGGASCLIGKMGGD